MIVTNDLFQTGKDRFDGERGADNSRIGSSLFFY